MKAAKLRQTTILMAFSLALAGIVSEAGASAKSRPTSKRINHPRQSKQPMTTAENTKRHTTGETQKRWPDSILTMLTTLIRMAQRLKDGMLWKSF